MAGFVVIYLILLVTSIACVNEIYGTSCDSLGILIYEDLGCKAVKKEGQECPVKYECDDFSLKNDSCLFKGKTYSLDEHIKNHLTHSTCSTSCACVLSFGEPRIICAIQDCPEWLGFPFKPKCYPKYEVDSCCSVGVICPSEDKSLTACYVNQRKFNEGNLIFPKNTCLKCVCDKNWNPNLQGSFCKKISCNTQLYKSEELQKKCAPFYFRQNAFCCPDTWICPASSDKIIEINKDVDSDSDLSCVFGSKTLKFGEGFNRQISYHGPEINIQCECVVPPFLTCKEI